MPTYSYFCKTCYSSFDVFSRISEHKNHQSCPICKTLSQQIINHAPMVIIPQHMRYDFEGYESPTSGAHITNMRQRANDMAASGCIEYEPGMRQDADRRVIEEDKALDKLVDETVEREFESMPIKQKETLCAELTAGATVETIRI